MKKRILYVQHSGGLGGAPNSLRILLENLNYDVFEPFLYIIREGQNKSLFDFLPKEKIYFGKRPEIIFHGSTVGNPSFYQFIKQMAFYNYTFKKAKKLISQIEPDIIHLNSSCAFVFAHAAKKYNPKIKVITHIREPLLDNYKGKILKKMNEKYSDAYIAISNYDMSTILDSHIEKRKFNDVIYNSIDIDTFNPNYKSEYIRERFHLNKDANIIITLSRICKENGILEFVRSIKEKNLDDTYFFIIGFKKNKSLYEDMVLEEIEKSDNVFSMCFTNNTRDIISSSDFLISPFKEPHFARSVIEAAAFGKPAIISNVASQKELVKNNITGFIYNNQEELIKYIEIFTKNKVLRERMGKEARKYAEENFSAKKNNQRIIEIYNKLL